MEKRIFLADILTPQEHIWFGSTAKFNPESREQWYMPDGVLRGNITLKEAIAERKNKSFVGGQIMASAIGIVGKDIAMSLEEIDETTGQTKDDPKILGIWDRKTNQITPAVDEETGEISDLTNKLVDKFREIGEEEKLHLRPRSTGEGQNPSFGEGNAGYRQ